MLTSLYPRAHARYTSSPILGRTLEGFCGWLHARGYARRVVRERVWATAWLERALRRRQVRSLRALTATMLRAYAPPRQGGVSRIRGALVRSLALYLDSLGELAPTSPTPTERLVAKYRRYLARVRGLRPSTAAMHAGTAREFLQFLDHDARPEGLHELRVADLDAFVARVGGRVGRGRMSGVVAALRSFLRFLAAEVEAPAGLDAHVDTPCVWRGERLSRALPWEQVRALLRSIDRTTPAGRRDYAMFLLIATYGLRTSEVRALELDDLAWRARQISVPRPKVGTPMLLPLTDEVGAALLDYLRSGRPPTTCRRVFLRFQMPLGPLGPCAVGHAFRTCAERSGIELPVRCGPHCLRHSLALRLLREGATLKTIGDILGHRSAEATGMYLRLDVDDLRDVALALPPAAIAEEVRP